MRRRTHTLPAASLRALVLLAALAPALPRATEVSGFVGGSMEKSDNWEAPTHTDGRQWGLNGGLSARGYLGTPDLVAWGLAAGYGQDRSLAQDASAQHNTLTYGANLSAFDFKGSELILRGTAARTQVGFSQSAGSEVIPGTSLSDNYSATVRAGGGQRPVLEITGDLSKAIVSNLDQPDIHLGSMGINATASSGNELFNYQLGYRARTEQGTFASSNSDYNDLTALARSRLTPSTEANLSARYYTRHATVDDPTNPTYEDAQVSVNSLTLYGGSTLTTGYGFTHTATTALGLPSTEHAGHGVNATDSLAIAPEWTLSPGANVSYAEDRVGAARISAAGEAASATLDWHRVVGQHSFGFQGGGNVGVIEPASGPVAGSWGTSASSRYGRGLPTGGWGVAYGLSYSANGNAELGWTMAQSASGDLNLRISDRSSLASTLLISANRGHTPLGEGANRNALLNVTLTGRDATFGMVLTATDGVAGNLASPVRGDGMFLSPAYQTHARSAQLYAAVPFPPHVVLAAATRYGTTSGPDFGNARVFQATCSLSYAIGKFTLSLSDTYTAEGSEFASRFNQVYVAFTRSFSL
ncbi:MAG TPA: hypothetical protein VF875_07700 [Anaeromyxobacter sp.]